VTRGNGDYESHGRPYVGPRIVCIFSGDFFRFVTPKYINYVLFRFELCVIFTVEEGAKGFLRFPQEPHLRNASSTLNILLTVNCHSISILVRYRITIIPLSSIMPLIAYHVIMGYALCTFQIGILEIRRDGQNLAGSLSPLAPSCPNR
jgi:hypothetical protein